MENLLTLSMPNPSGFSEDLTGTVPGPIPLPSGKAELAFSRCYSGRGRLERSGEDLCFPPPFQGWSWDVPATQGFAFAAPWAIFLRRFAAGRERRGAEIERVAKMLFKSTSPPRGAAGWKRAVGRPELLRSKSSRPALGLRPHGAAVRGHRSLRKNLRRSSTNSSGSSMAAKCPPRGISVQWVTL